MFRLLLHLITLGHFKYRMSNGFLFTRKGVKYADFPRINGFLSIRGQGKISIGKKLAVNSGKNFNPIGGDTKTNWVVKPKAQLLIGDHVGMSNCTLVCHEQIAIGNHVKIGGGVKMYDTDFHALDAESRRNRKTDIGQTKPIRIGNDAFIGAHSVILKGVTIGEASIVGAGSLVTKSIPPGQIWGGNPAKYIKDIE